VDHHVQQRRHRENASLLELQRTEGVEAVTGERLWTGRASTDVACAGCSRLVGAGDVYVVLASGLAVVNVCSRCHVEALPSPQAKVWHAGTSL
jgi:hypothetical protein